MTAMLLALALLLDWLLPSQWRPLASVERLAAWWVQRTRNMGRLGGALAAAALLLPPVWLAAEWLDPAALASEPWRAAVAALLLSALLGLRHLHEQVRATGDASAACREALVAGGVFGVLFWFLVAGLAGALLYRLAHALAASWRNDAPSQPALAWAAAWLEDSLNIVPARLAALGYALLGLPRGRTRRALDYWREQVPAWHDANAGPPLAAGAAVLDISLEGPVDEQDECVVLGDDEAPAPLDGERALALARQGVLLWLAAIGLGTLAWWELAPHLPDWEQLPDFLWETLLA